MGLAVCSRLPGLQAYLTRFGYIQSPELQVFGVEAARAAVPKATPGTFDENTEQALRQFQRFAGLEETGEATLALMAKPRWGFPDAPSFVLQGTNGRRTP